MSKGDGKRTGRVYFTRGRARDEPSSSGGEEEDPFQYQDCPQKLPESLPTISEEVPETVTSETEQHH